MWCYKMDFEDINTIVEKYTGLSFWYELSFDDIVDNITSTDENNPDRIDFIEGYIDESTGYYNLTAVNNFIVGQRQAWSTIPSRKSGSIKIHINNVNISSFPNRDSIYIYISVDKKRNNPNLYNVHWWIEDSRLILFRTDNFIERKSIYIGFATGFRPDSVTAGTFYYDDNGDWVTHGKSYTIERRIEEARFRYYFDFEPDNYENDEYLFITGEDWTGNTFTYTGKLINYADLPIITYDPLYKGNKQHIQLYFNGTEIDDEYYNIIYENTRLKNNTIQIPTDTDTLQVQIELNHPDYIQTTIDYELHTDYYYFGSANDIATAKELGLTTVKQNNNSAATITQGFKLNDMTIYGSDGGFFCKLSGNDEFVFTNCILNSLIIGSSIPKISFNNCEIKECEIDKWNWSTPPYTLEVEDTNIIESTIKNARLNNCNNTNITNNTFENTLIVSDSDNLTITGNTFNDGFTVLDYFPNTLYLTGAFKASNNTFNQTLTYDEVSFNTALLKTIPDTDIDGFIFQNTFNLSNTVESETYTGLFYNLIDDDTLKYKEVE